MDDVVDNVVAVAVVVDMDTVVVTLVAVAVVEVMQLNSRSYPSKSASADSGGSSVNRRHEPFDGRNETNRHCGRTEQSFAHSFASLACCASMS